MLTIPTDFLYAPVVAHCPVCKLAATMYAYWDRLLGIRRYFIANKQGQFKTGLQAATSAER